MSGKSDVAKGRLKEAAGALLDNDSLRKKGKTDQLVGKAKKGVEKVGRKIEKKVRKIINKVEGVAP
jgi:uncharacterized protein YjbJ (UPF0337 family)